MGAGLKVIALISGGKDSLFSILHCLENGHQVVALANIHPPLTPIDVEGNTSGMEHEEADSYMFQSVGHTVIPLYERALGIPLYRQKIEGRALNMSIDYFPVVADKTGDVDEIESLIPLLKRIVREHPEANAISTGAILSTYQRTRIESVACRMNLIPLAYLWQYPSLPPYNQTSLLEDMHFVGQESRIVKVASGGLSRRFLWKDVSSPLVMRDLGIAMARFGTENGSVLGEGGEFETLALDGPSKLWKQRIVVYDHAHIPGEGDSAAVLIRSAAVEPKELSHNGERTVRIPCILDYEFQHVLFSLGDSEGNTERHYGSVSHHCARDILGIGCRNLKKLVGGFIYLSNWSGVPETSPEQQLRKILEPINVELSLLSVRPTVVSSILLLRSMDDFTILNPIYGTLFPRPSPASRVTVACGERMPTGIHVILSLVLDISSQLPRGLHVQSRSYWAPANIGPYSQAISVQISPKRDEDDEDLSISSVNTAEFVYVAGQIPLIPASMDLVSAQDIDTFGLPKDQGSCSVFKVQAVLALQHLWRVGRAMRVDFWAGVVAYISHCEPRTADRRKRIAQKTWSLAHAHPSIDGNASDDESDDVDIWDLRNNPAATFVDSRRDTRAPLPNPERLYIKDLTILEVPPCFVVQINQLPRGAAIEWASSGFAMCTGRTFVQEHCGLKLEGVLAKAERAWVVWVAVHQVEEFQRIEPALQALWFWDEAREYEVGVYAAVQIPEIWTFKHKPFIVPCERVWASDGVECDAVVMVRNLVV